MSTGLEAFLPAYLAEVDELLGSANRQILRIETAARTDAPSTRELRELFRALHTIKGLSAMIDVEPIVAIAHRMETVLRTADRRGGRLPVAAIDPMLRGLRAIETGMRALEAGKAVEPAPEALLSRIESIDAEAVGVAKPAGASVSLSLPEEIAAKLAPADGEHLLEGVRGGKRAALARFVPSPVKSASGRTITSVRATIGEIAEIVKVVPIGVPQSVDVPGGLIFSLVVLTAASNATLAERLGEGDEAVATIAEPLDVAEDDAEVEAAPIETRGDEPVRPGLVRVAVSRLDEALESLSAVIVGRSRLAMAVAELRAQGVDVRALDRVLGEGKRELRDLRASILRLRMIPMRETLERLPLVVRSLQIATGKRVTLDVVAGETEIDKSVADRLFPVIVHLVRNAVDHAIEDEAERARLEKPALGSVAVCCRSRATDLEVTVQDDGRGVSREAVSARVGAPIGSDAALLDVLCRAGFSTRDAVTTTSGRGIGMDVVRRVVVDELGGELTLATTPGVGTTFTLRVPLSLSITDALLFECAQQRFAVPVRTVEEIVDIDAATVVRPPRADRRRGERDVALIERRGRVMPLVMLGRRLRLSQADAAPCALVVRRDAEPIAFGIDRLLGHQEIVVRPVVDALVSRPGVAGSTDLGDGRPTLVLDLPRLGAEREERIA